MRYQLCCCKPLGSVAACKIRLETLQTRQRGRDGDSTWSSEGGGGGDSVSAIYWAHVGSWDKKSVLKVTKKRVQGSGVSEEES